MKKNDSDLKIRFATLDDLDKIVRLHYKCFTVKNNISMLFGTEYVRANYKWFLTASEACVFIAEKNGRLAGMAVVSDRRYKGPIMRACKGQAVKGVLKRPWVIFHPELFVRLIRKLFGSSKSKIDENIAQIAFNMVDSDFRGEGLGVIIQEEAKRISRERGNKILMVGLRRDNLAARRVNEKVGFKEKTEAATKRFIYMTMRLDD